MRQFHSSKMIPALALALGVACTPQAATDPDQSLDAESDTNFEESVSDNGDDDRSAEGGLNLDAIDFDVPYAFESRFQEGSSVQYTDAIVRQALICEMKFEAGKVITQSIDNDGHVYEPGDVRDILEFYYFFPEEGCDKEFISAPSNVLQMTVNELRCGANLQEAMAGNNPVLAHLDEPGRLLGWDQEGVSTPEDLVRQWITEIDEAAVERSITGEGPTRHTYLSVDGVDRHQLLEKFLQAALTFAPAAAGHMTMDVPNRGLLSDNTRARSPGEAFSALEALWDESFGYYGANRTFGLHHAMDIKADLGHDADGDGYLDLTSEFAWGASMMAAKRDVNVPEPVDLLGDGWKGFLGGRTIIANASGPDGALTDAELDALEDFARQALNGWEAAIAASSVRQINRSLNQLQIALAGGDEYTLSEYAKAWGQAKGYALWFQFNPNSLLSVSDFERLHSLLGMAPTLPDGDAEAYIEDLIAARTLLGDVYGFPAVNLGDEFGENGW